MQTQTSGRMTLLSVPAQRSPIDVNAAKNVVSCVVVLVVVRGVHEAARPTGPAAAAAATCKSISGAVQADRLAGRHTRQPGHRQRRRARLISTSARSLLA